MRTRSSLVLLATAWLVNCSSDPPEQEAVQPISEATGPGSGSTTTNTPPVDGTATSSTDATNTGSAPGVVQPGVPPGQPTPQEPSIGMPGVNTPLTPPMTATPPANTPAAPTTPPTPTEETPTPPDTPNGGAPSAEPEPAVAEGGGTSVEPEMGAAGMPPMLPPGVCDNMMRDGDETAIDCGGSCPACPGYPASTPDVENEDRSGCEPSGNGFMCTQSMLLSPSMKQAVYEDWGMDDPPFAYAVVGHDPDPGGVDDQSASYSSTCCQCYQLVFKGPRASNESLPAPKPLIVQAFNTYAGGPSAFDVYMAAGGYGNFNGCTENGQLYSGFPDMGGDWTGGVRATRYGQCNTDMGFTESSVSSEQCQTFVEGECNKIQASELVQSISQQSCEQSNRIESHYHTNWNVVVKRVECPEALTKVTGCRLAPQGLPEADPAIQTAQQAMQAGFRDGDYHTTTMQDCCRPTCAWPTNVSNTTSGYTHFYTCDSSGNQR